MNTTPVEAAAAGAADCASRARCTLALAGLLIAAATALGALGAHALQASLPPARLAVYETAVRYHFLHALGLLAIGLLMRSSASRLLAWSARLVIAGVLLFSGSIYAIVFGAPRSLGAITPLGGACLMAGWVLFALAAWREVAPKSRA